jgi:hypothetical protein
MTSDLFSLIQIFHEFRSVNQALRIIADEFDRIDEFESHGVQKREKTIRYAVPKQEIYNLIVRYSDNRRQHILQLVEEATDLIRACMIVELDHGRVFSNNFAFFRPHIIDDNILARINGLSIRLYLWLLIKQEVNARENKWGI